MRKIFVVIVNYNEKTKTLKLLGQLEKVNKTVKLIPVVVDNHSNDESAEVIKKSYPQVILISTPKNIGYGAAANKAIRLGLYQKADYFWFLNPDTVVPKDFLIKMMKIKGDLVAPVIKYKKNHNWVYDLGGKINWLWGRTKHTEIIRHSGESSQTRRLQNHFQCERFWASQNDEKSDIDYLSGCCIRIKRTVFEKIGLFDERFFLYYEDADFCLRGVKAGFSLRLASEITIIHQLKGQEKGNHKPFFNLYHNLASNLLFILKYQSGFGLITSWLYFILLTGKVIFNETVGKLRRNLFFFMVLALALFLRTYDIAGSLPFTHEIGRDYLAAKHIFFDHQILLLGPPSSHTWLFHGPLFYYLLAFALSIFNSSPFSGYFLVLFGSVISLFCLYYLTERLFSKTTALVALLYSSVFPLSVALDRIPAHYALVPLFSLLGFGTFLFYLKRHKNIWLIICGLSLGCGVQMHLSSLILVFFCVGMLALSKKVKEIGLFLLFFLLPLTPLLFFDYSEKFVMLRSLLLWFPYRVLRFSWLSWQWVAVAGVAGLFALWIVRKARDNLALLLLFMAFSLLLLFLHGNPPIHYFYFLLPELIILASRVTVNLGSEKNLLRKILAFVMMLVWSGGSLFFFFRSYLPSQLNPGSYPVRLVDQEKAVILILADAGNQPFKLKRFGDLDIFAGYLDNYRYLVWWLSGLEEDKKASLTYTIYEDRNKFKQYANLNDKFIYLQRVIIEKTL